MRLLPVATAASVAAAAAAEPLNCPYTVAGAGIGGVYWAWRLAIDTSTISATEVCIFEATQIVAGRMYTTSDAPALDDLRIDVGAYRYRTNEGLPRDLIESALGLPVAPYDVNDTAMRVIADVYGNNAGYATVVERMIEQLVAGGARFAKGTPLLRVTPAGADGSLLLDLGDVAGTQATTLKLMLNMPDNAVKHLDRDSVIFTEAGAEAQCAMSATQQSGAGCKVMAHYADAWWITKMNPPRLSGSFSAGGDSPLSGRYHDGPVKCTDRAGRRLPSWPARLARELQQNTSVGRLECTGVLMGYYSYNSCAGNPSYNTYQADRDDPFTLVLDRVRDRNHALLEGFHSALMHHHESSLSVPVAQIPRPDAVYLGSWTSEATLKPATCSYSNAVLDECGLDRRGARLRWMKLLDDRDIYTTNIDGAGGCAAWAVDAMVTTEYILRHHFHLAAPSWLDHAWYERTVANF